MGFPGEDEAALRGHRARVAEDLAMSKVHVFPVLARGRARRRRDGGPPAGRTSCASGPGGCATSPTGSASRTARRRVGGRDRVLVERRHPDGTLGGLGADYTRFVLPAGAGAPGEMVAVAVEGVAGEHLAGRPL